MQRALRTSDFFVSGLAVTLEESKLFGQISPKELGILKGLARGQSFSAGQELFKEGDPGDGPISCGRAWSKYP